jgi:hypothetical protein
MPIRFSTKTALFIALTTLISATAAHADSGYQPYYSSSTRDAIQFTNTTPPQASGVAVTPVYAPGQPSNWQQPKVTVQQGTPTEVPENWNNDTSLFHFNNTAWGSAGTEFLNFKRYGLTGSTSDRGWMPSIEGGASYATHDNLYFELDGSDTFDNVTHHAPVQTTVRETTYTADGKIGQGFYVANPSVMLIPYVDVGYRHWTRNNSNGATEQYFHNFATMGGLMVEATPNDRIFLAAYGAGGTTLGAQMTSGGDSYKLGSSGVYDVGGKVGFNLTQRIELFSTLDYLHFRYGQSSINSDNTVESSSATNETTVRVGLGYHFR